LKKKKKNPGFDFFKKKKKKSEWKNHQFWLFQKPQRTNDDFHERIDDSWADSLTFLINLFFENHGCLKIL